MAKMTRVGAALSIFLAASVDEPASAQTLADSINGAFKRASATLHQQATPGHPKIESRRSAGHAAVTTTAVASPRNPPVLAQSVLPVDRDSLSGTRRSSYKLPSGIVIESTGDFSASKDTHCVANCPASATKGHP